MRSIDCYLEGADEHFPFAIAIPFSRRAKGAGHFSEEAAEFAFARRGRLIRGGQRFFIVFLQKGLGGKRGLLFGDIHLPDCYCHAG